MKPDGTSRSCLRYRRTVRVTTTKTNAATSHSMKTCLVTEKLMPAIVGRWISGWSSPLFDTCSMIVLPALNPSAASSARCSGACSWT